MARTFLTVLAGVLLASSAVAQTRTLTIDDLFDPQKKIDFSGGAPAGIQWSSDTHYKKSSALAAARHLHGQLLLIHGVIDDNVHMQNTLKFAYELQKAGKPFRMMVYERSRHGVTDPDLVRHMRQMMFDFTTETLLKPAETRATTTAR